MEMSLSKLVSFPIARDTFRGYYYPYGNTPPTDLLEHIHIPPCEEPSVLVLGCGDIRSCLYTMWKHFDPLHCNDWCTKITFTLCDQSAAVLARNVLFLYLLINNAEMEVKNWIPSVWAIWYCHELRPHHWEMLKSALTDLLSLSKSYEEWTSSDSVVCSVCRFSEDTLKQMHEMWKIWRYKSFGTPELVKDLRERDQKECMFNVGISSHYVSVFLGESKKGTEVSRFNAMIKDYEYYAKKGTAYAEGVCKQSDRCCGNQPIVNPTFFERYLDESKDENFYTTCSTLVPYRCFYHSVLFSSDKMSQSAILEANAFQKHPLLANSVQQFSLWLSSAAKVLNHKKPSVKFIFHCSKAIEYCQLSPDNDFKYDVIYTSNLLDYISPLILVLPTVMLLKENCVLVTTCLHPEKIPSKEGFIKQTFGFEAELLPAVFGIRCIGCDGKYADNKSIEPNPYLQSSRSIFLNMYTEGIASRIIDCFATTMIWEKVSLEPLQVKSLGELPAICKALYNMAEQSVLSFFKEQYEYMTCTETMITALLCFASQLHSAVPYKNYQFWEHLCDLLRDNANLKPFLHHIQTHALLHGLHLHLIHNESDCPICSNVPISDFVHQLAVRFPLPNNTSKLGVPSFTIFLHPQDRFNLDQTSSPWEVEAFVVDSITCKEEASQIEISFFTSQLENVFMTIVAHRVDKRLQDKVISINSLPLSSARIVQPFTYSFVQANVRSISNSSSLGTVIEHAGDSDKFCSQILLSEAVTSALNSKLTKGYLSPCTLDISVGQHHFHLAYPYAINSSKVRVTFSNDKGKIDVKIARDISKWFHEKPLFIAIPLNKVCFPDLSIVDGAPNEYDDRQYTRSEIKSLESGKRFGIIGVKKSISTLIHCSGQYITLLDSKDKSKWRGLIVVHRRIFDIEKQSPAIHISFVMKVAPADSAYTPLLEIWSQIRSTSWPIDDDAAVMLEEVLMKFAARTQISKTSRTILTEYNVEHFFTQAVVYPLYMDYNKYVADVMAHI